MKVNRNQLIRENPRGSIERKFVVTYENYNFRQSHLFIHKIIYIHFMMLSFEPYAFQTVSHKVKNKITCVRQRLPHVQVLVLAAHLVGPTYVSNDYQIY